MNRARTPTQTLTTLLVLIQAPLSLALGTMLESAWARGRAAGTLVLALWASMVRDGAGAKVFECTHLTNPVTQVRGSTLELGVGGQAWGQAYECKTSRGEVWAMKDTATCCGATTTCPCVPGTQYADGALGVAAKGTDRCKARGRSGRPPLALAPTAVHFCARPMI